MLYVIFIKKSDDKEKGVGSYVLTIENENENFFLSKENMTSLNQRIISYKTAFTAKP